jgi:hypothetical protein
MGILTPGCSIAAALALLAGCYAPAVRDCVVSCASPGDCASGQTCGSDGLCAGLDRAGHCASGVPGDGPRPRPDAATVVDAPGRDASPRVSLHVQVSGKGSVVVVDQGTCSSQDPQRGDCTYDLAQGVAQTVYAVAIQPGERFSKWTSMTCRGEDASCTFTPAAATNLEAKFEHSGDNL